MPLPACSITIQTVPEEGTPYEEVVGEAPAYRFRLADAKKAAGSGFQARIEFASGGAAEPRGEGKLTITNLTGLTIKQSEAIAKGAWVKVQGGYHDKRPGPDTICFFGQLDDLSYELNRGQLLWRLSASATPGAAYSTKVNAYFPGAQSYAAIFEGLLAKAGIAGFNAATLAKQHGLNDYSTKGLTVIEELRDLALQLRRDARLSDGSEPRIIIAPYVGAAGGDVASLVLVDLDETYAEVAYNLNLDLVHSAVPEVDTTVVPDVDEFTEDDEDAVIVPTTRGQKRFNIVMDFDPNVRNGVLTMGRSQAHGIQKLMRVDGYTHTIGTNQWQTQLNGEVIPNVSQPQ